MIAKIKLNNGYNWVKENPKTTASIVLNAALICALTYAIISHKSLSADKYKIETENNNLIIKLDVLRNKLGQKAQLSESIKNDLTNENTKLLLKLDNLRPEKENLISTIKEQAEQIHSLAKSKSEIEHKLSENVKKMGELFNISKKQQFLINALREAGSILLRENEQLRAGEFPWLSRN